jgi:hypothetical protein
MSVVGCTKDIKPIGPSILISRGIIGGILVAGAVVVGTFLPGYSPHIDTEASGRSLTPAIAQTVTSATALSLHHKIGRVRGQ